MAIAWLVIGILMVLAAAILIARMQSVELGPYATRLIAIAIALLGYYGASARWPGVFGPLSVHGNPVVFYVVPVAAGLAAVYAVYRIVRGWRSELHGLVTGALKLLLTLALALAARWCLARWR